MSSPAEQSDRRLQLSLLILLVAVSLVLRVARLGNTFQSSDNAELAARVVLNPGYSWMIRERYGVLISLVVKLFVGSASSLGITITEFWWKLPIALLGTLQVPLAFFFLKRLGCARTGALAGAALVAVLPVHVMQSRYLWGYEVFGVFFITLALWALLNFLERPTLRTGLAASLCSGLYLISHGYVIPFMFCLVSMLILFAPAERKGPLNRLGAWIKLLTRNLVWVFPLLFFPLYQHPLQHALRKPTRAGLYLGDHVAGFVENTGLALTLLLLAGVIAVVAWGQARSHRSGLLAICGGWYLAPLFFLAPPGITVVRGYMLVGIYLLTLCTATVLDRLAQSRRGLALALISICLAVTLWGTVESIFGRDEWIDPGLVRAERGVTGPDPGTKAAGYLVRKHVPASATVLAIHRAVEPPNMVYYFGRRHHGYYDLSLEESLGRFLEMKDTSDVVICEKDQRPAIEADGRFDERGVILSEGAPRMWIYARAGVALPTIRADVRELNRAFDREYAPHVRLW